MLSSPNFSVEHNLQWLSFTKILRIVDYAGTKMCSKNWDLIEINYGKIIPACKP